MKVVLVAVVGLVMGVVAGAGVGGTRVKGEILEVRAQAAADSTAAAREAASAQSDAHAADDQAASAHAPVAEDVPEVAVTADPTSENHDPTERSPEDGAATHTADARIEDDGPGGATFAENPGPPSEEPSDGAAGEEEATQEQDEEIAADPGPAAGLATPGTPGPSDWTEGMNAEGAKKLSKIFAAMKPQDAAEVLVGMSDNEVKAILLQMSDRQAGPILQAFPADRAADLSRVVLRTPEGGS